MTNFCRYFFTKFIVNYSCMRMKAYAKYATAQAPPPNSVAQHGSDDGLVSTVSCVCWTKFKTTKLNMLYNYYTNVLCLLGTRKMGDAGMVVLWILVDVCDAGPALI